jgi:3',5'-cyclic AMP phosphodiesterase CpdA
MKPEQKARVKKSLPKVLAFLLVLTVLLTAPCKSWALTFAVMGDTRDNKATFAAVMGEITALAPDLVIHTGDWVSAPSRQGWEEFLPVMKQPGVPFVLTIGNHELGNGWKQLYQELVKKPLYYSFTKDNCLFITLFPYTKESGRIDAEQFAWLEKELADKGPSSDFIFVFVHEPLYPVDGHVGSSLDRYPADRDKLAQLLRTWKNKLVVFCGHEHIFNYSVVDGLVQVITGGGGAPLSSTPDRGGFYHYVIVTVKGKTITMALVRLGSISQIPAVSKGTP